MELPGRSGDYLFVIFVRTETFSETLGVSLWMSKAVNSIKCNRTNELSINLLSLTHVGGVQRLSLVHYQPHLLMLSVAAEPGSAGEAREARLLQAKVSRILHLCLGLCTVSRFESPNVVGSCMFRHTHTGCNEHVKSQTSLALNKND